MRTYLLAPALLATAFVAAMASAGPPPPDLNPIIFVHGYNNDFTDSVRTIGNLWHFMGRQGVPIAYTWPAGAGGLAGYTTDRESCEFTIFHLKTFLEDLAADPEIEKIHILAHSRGTDVSVTAVRELAIAARCTRRCATLNR